MAMLLLLFAALVVAPKCTTMALSENNDKSPTTPSLFPPPPPPPPYLPPYYLESPILANSPPSPPPPPPPHASFDFLMLAQTWPTSFCNLPNNNCVNKPASPVKFSIHGLWPQDNKGTPLLSCSPPEPFDYHKLTGGDNPVSPTDLTKYWPNLKNSADNQKFWEDEWDKHGSCSSMALKDYFHLTLQIYLKKDLRSILQMNRITPGGGGGGRSKVGSMAIFNAIKAATQHDPKIVCVNSYLLEIRICLDKTGVNYIDCVATASEPLVKCPPSVLFP